MVNKFGHFLYSWQYFSELIASHSIVILPKQRAFSVSRIVYTCQKKKKKKKKKERKIKEKEKKRKRPKEQWVCRNIKHCKIIMVTCRRCMTFRENEEVQSGLIEAVRLHQSTLYSVYLLIKKNSILQSLVAWFSDIEVYTLFIIPDAWRQLVSGSLFLFKTIQKASLYFTYWRHISGIII